MAQAYVDGGPSAGNRLMAGFDEAAASLEEQLSPFVEQQIKELDQSMQTIIAEAGVLRRGILAAGLIITISGLFLAWGLTRAIIKPVQNIIDSLNASSA